MIQAIYCLVCRVLMELNGSNKDEVDYKICERCKR